MGKFSTGLRRSSPTILTVLGIVGVVGTAVTAVRATPKAMRLIKAKKDELETDKLTPVELVQTTWKCYIPSVLVGVGTVACIIGIGVMDKRNQAALTSAYAMLNESDKQPKRFMAKMLITKSMLKWLKMQWLLILHGVIKFITWIWTPKVRSVFSMTLHRRNTLLQQWLLF